MLIQDWNSFYEQAESLYRNDPLKTRYVLKYIHKSGKLQLKVTDDRVVSSSAARAHLILASIHRSCSYFHASVRHPS